VIHGKRQVEIDLTDIKQWQFNSKERSLKNCNIYKQNKGWTLIELLVFILMLSVGLALSSYLGKKIGCIGFVVGF
jgi:hypothetical protein